MATESILAVEYIFPVSKKGFMTPLSSLKPLEGFALMNNISYVECLCDFHGVITPLPPNFDALRLLLFPTKSAFTHHLLQIDLRVRNRRFNKTSTLHGKKKKKKKVLERNLYIGHNLL